MLGKLLLCLLGVIFPAIFSLNVTVFPPLELVLLWAAWFGDIEMGYMYAPELGVPAFIGRRGAGLSFVAITGPTWDVVTPY